VISLHTRNGAEKEFVKYYVSLYPFPRRDKLKCANKPRNLVLATNSIFVQNVKRLASNNALSVNNFMNKILTDHCLTALQEPLLYKKIIPGY
jgi:hypothetical protein